LEFVRWLIHSYGVSGRENTGHVVESVSDSNIFGDIAGMENICANWGYLDLDRILREALNIETHLGGAFTNLILV
jgi:hypothetical protein